MFTVAPRYLSGVSIFYGDDITKRSVEGEVAIFVGQATKGPNTPVQLSTPEAATTIYGTENPLVKALYEFNDGWYDSPRQQNIKYVTLRIGGISAVLSTSFGLTLSTVDAYSGIENDFYVYVVDTSAAAARVKVWDKNKLLVLDTANNINLGYVSVDNMNTGSSAKTYGVDIDNDPLETPVTLAGLVDEDITYVGGSAVHPATTIALGATTVVTAEAISSFPASGFMHIKEVSGAITRACIVEYTGKDDGTKTFTLKTGVTVPYNFTSSADIGIIGSTLIAGDSQLNLTKRQIYEKMRNALLDVENFTPDYIIPGGVAFNDAVSYVKSNSETTTLINSSVNADASIVVDAASTWPSTGRLTITDGTDEDIIDYTAKAVNGSNFTITLDRPTYAVDSVDGVSQLYVILEADGTGRDPELIPAKGIVKITHSSTSYYYRYTQDATNPAKLNFASAIESSITAGDTVQKVIDIFDAAQTTVTVNYQTIQNFELGLGYCVEVDHGDHFSFTWSDTKVAGSYLAHFGFLFANFCNNAAVGYNTPLCGMNVAMPTAYDRASIVSWIGSLPTYQLQGGTTSQISAIVASGSGLLGDPVLAGSKNFNRCYLNSAVEGLYVDPAYGLLMNDVGFIDGHEMKDDYNKLIDLGKFMCVGAGIMTFNNKASNLAYNDGCGIYSLGVLSGKPKNEGITFTQIGVGSSASVSVIVNRNLYNSLAGLGYIVVTREKGFGWVVNNDNSVARDDSGYYLISTTRTVKNVLEAKRSILLGFLGKPVNTFYYEAAKTSLADSFTSDLNTGMLNGFKFTLEVVETARAIGKFLLKTSLNPPLELVQVDIDGVIDRSLTSE
jgi:hypothetical protein